MIRKSHIAALSILTLLIVQQSSGQSTASQDSRVWIEGTSTVSSFTCISEDVEGPGLLSGSPANDLEIPVATFDCGNGKMNRDLRKALRWEEHPSIRFDAERIDVEEEGGDLIRLRTTGQLEIAGVERTVDISLEAAFEDEEDRLEGEGRPENEARAEDGDEAVTADDAGADDGDEGSDENGDEADTVAGDYVRMSGSMDLLLSSFDVDPPTALLGLVRVRDEVVVHFELIEPAADLTALISRSSSR